MLHIYASQDIKLNMSVHDRIRRDPVTVQEITQHFA